MQRLRAAVVRVHPAVVAAWAVAVVVLVPLAAAVVASWGRSWLPAGDWAMIELATADTGTSNTRLLGPYSRFGWSHPGPMLFWLLAVPYRLGGSASWTLMTTAAVVNLAAVAGTLVFAWRRGGVVLTALVALALGAVVAAVKTGMPADPWNPWITVFPTALLVMLVVSVFNGDRVALPLAVVVGSFVAQSHVGYGPLVAALWITGVVGAWRHGVVTRRWLLWGGVLPLVVLWLPPAVDQLFGRGNLVRLLTGVGGTDEPVGLTGALQVAARQLAWGGPWMGGAEPKNPYTGSVDGRPVAALAMPVLVFVAAAGVAAWRRCHDAVRLQIVVGVAVVVGTLAVSRITGFTFDYLLRWWWPLAALWWASAGWSLWQAVFAPGSGTADRADGATGGTAEVLRGNGSARRTVVAQTLLVVLALVVLVPQSWTTAGDTYRYVNTGDAFQTVVASASSAVDTALGGVDGEVELHMSGYGGGWVGDAVGLHLEQAGWDVVVARNDLNVAKWGWGRSVDVDEMRWRERTDRPGDGGRPAVWVVDDPMKSPPIDLTDPRVTMVFSGDFGDDEIPAGSVQVYVAR